LHDYGGSKSRKGDNLAAGKAASLLRIVACRRIR